MRRAVRQLVIFLVVAVMAFGNGLSFASASTVVHHHGSHDVGTEHQSAVHHTHADGAKHYATLADVISEHCIGSDCDDSGHANHPCCHTHVHCCSSIVSLPISAVVANRSASKGALLIAARAPIPLGAISHPLLRPPRLSA